MNIKKQIFIMFMIIVFTILLSSYTNIDETIQNYFYNFKTHKWLIDRNLEPYKFIFYDGIKKLLILIALSFVIAFFIPKFKQYKKRLLIVILSAILIPLFIGFLKKETNMPCPKNRIEYGGVYPKTKIWEHYPKNFHKPKIKCWPAGHASGGFALMSLFFLFRKRKYKIIALSLGISIGWLMGIYKMLIGDHFLSHTILTMEIAWFIILIIVYIVRKENARDSKPVRKFFFISNNKIR